MFYCGNGSLDDSVNKMTSIDVILEYFLQGEVRLAVVVLLSVDMQIN